MTQTQMSKVGWSPPSSSRRLFLRVFAAGATVNTLAGGARRASSQTLKEIQGMNAWTKQGRSYIPPNGFVPDTKTALRVAEAILIAVYGEEEIAKQRPFKIALVDNEVWLVWGTLDQRYLGGTGVIKISKRTGKVLFLSHGV